MGYRVLHIGVDDTDSKGGMCTTYVGAVARDRLLSLGLEEADYPSLVRLNPNCPFKTRGNAAVALHMRCPATLVDEAFKAVVEVVEELYERGYGDTQPGVAMRLGGSTPEELRGFAYRAVTELVELDEALNLAERHNIRIHRINGGRGVIGALAAVSYELGEHTFEAIAYRTRDNWGTVRRVDRQSVFEMDRITRGRTFDNVDYEAGEVRVTPHTPCPVLAGVRALTAEDALRGLGMIRFLEPVERVVVYRTNQATDRHLTARRIEELKPYVNAVVEGVVSSRPSTIKGGHVFFKLSDGTGEVVCAAYEPTKTLKKIAKQLIPGDRVKAMGGVKPKPEGLTLNLEKLEILELAELTVEKPPVCESCNRTMKSRGRGRGYECWGCGSVKGDAERRIVKLERGVRPGIYEAAASARRHLSKPLELCIRGVKRGGGEGSACYD